MHIKLPAVPTYSTDDLEVRPRRAARRLTGWALLGVILFGELALLASATSVQLHGVISERAVFYLISIGTYLWATVALLSVGPSGSWTRGRHRIALVEMIAICGLGAALHQRGVSQAIVTTVAGTATLLVWAAAWRRIEVRAICWIRRRRTVAFIGNSESAARMLRELDADSDSQLDAIGFFDDRHARTGPLSRHLPRLGGVEEVVAFLQEYPLSEVFVALPWSASQRMAQLLERLRFLPLTVRLIPDHVPPSAIGSRRNTSTDVVMPTLMVPPFSATGGLVKRCLDLAIACVLVVPLLPLFAIVAVAIRLDSAGPVFFRQARSGQFGRSFMIYKFRSLHQSRVDVGAETLVTHGDSRVTRVGRVLRKYSIDELPQIFNVILGHMSLVGPRPHAPRAKANGRIYSEVLPDYALRYRVKPGMTGWAQVNGWRGNTDTEDQLRSRVEFDFDYIGRWSIWRDFIILGRTIPSMLMPPAHNA